MDQIVKWQGRELRVTGYVNDGGGYDWSQLSFLVDDTTGDIFFVDEAGCSCNSPLETRWGSDDNELISVDPQQIHDLSEFATRYRASFRKNESRYGGYSKNDVADLNKEIARLRRFQRSFQAKEQTGE